MRGSSAVPTIPIVVTPERLAIAEQRLALHCVTCPAFISARLETLTVNCHKQRRRCSCPNGEVRLDIGRCPAELW